MIEFQLAFAELPEAVRGLEIKNMGGACPFQATGTVKDHKGGTNYFHFRYRNGWASVSVNGPFSDFNEVSDGMAYGHPLDGTLTDDEFATLLANLLPEVFVP